MPKMKEWLSNLINGVVQNVIANVVLIVAIPVIGLIYAFSTGNPQIALLVVLIVLTAINSLIGIGLLRQQRTAAQMLKELSGLKR